MDTNSYNPFDPRKTTLYNPKPVRPDNRTSPQSITPWTSVCTKRDTLQVRNDSDRYADCETIPTSISSQLVEAYQKSILKHVQPIAFALTHHSLAPISSVERLNSVRRALLLCRCVTRSKLSNNICFLVPCDIYDKTYYANKRAPSTEKFTDLPSQSKHISIQHSLLLSLVIILQQHTVYRHSCINLFLFVLPRLLLFCFFFYTTFISADICTLPTSIVLTLSPH